MAQRQSIAELLGTFLSHGGETAYIFRRGYRTIRWSYGEVAQVAFQFARELEQRKIGKGDRVLLWGENSAEWVAVFWGCMLRGVVAVPVDRISLADFGRRVFEQVEAKLVVGSGEALEVLGRASGIRLDLLREKMAIHSHKPYPGEHLAREDMAEIIFTSGSTAEPRGVVLTHGNILANLTPLETEITKYRKYERIVHPLRFLNLLPFSHVFGQFLGLFIPQLMGATVLLQESLNPREIIAALKKEGISVVVTVPRVLESLKDKIRRDFALQGKGEWFKTQLQAAADEHFVRRWWRFRRIHRLFGWKCWAFISGGAALDAETEEFWRRLGLVVIQGYGLTETTSLISLNHPFKLGAKSIGKVLPGREVKLDENGEILVRGENIATGYWQSRQILPVAGDEGWFRTGDIGELDAQGNLYFKGRKKNVIVTTGGMKVYPADLEAVLRQQPQVKDALIMGVARGGNAEACAVLVLRGHGGDPAEVVKRANDKLADYQRIRYWLVWPEEDFPRTPTQKPRLNVIQSWAEAQLSGRTPVLGEGGLAALISRISKNQARANVSQPAEKRARLEDDLNLSSLDRVELASAIEDRYGVDLDESEITASTTLEQLERLLETRPTSKSNFVYPRWAQRRPVHWLRAFVYYLLVWPATMLLAKPEIRGGEHTTDVTSSALIVCNHVTAVDIGFIQAALPARLRTNLAVAMQGEMLQAMRTPPKRWNFVRRWFEQLQYVLVVALFNVFPLPQVSGFRQSFRYAGESADRGYSIVVFPEGRRTQTGETNPFRKGIGLLAQRLNLPVIPMRIDGLFGLKTAKKRFAKPGTVRVSVGAPIRFAPEAPAEQITGELERAVAALGS